MKDFEVKKTSRDYTFQITRKRKYMYYQCKVTIPELIDVFKATAEEWVKETNERRRDYVKQLQSLFNEYDPNQKKTKREIKDDLQDLKDNWEDNYRPVTIDDYLKRGDSYDTKFDSHVNPADGSFEFEFSHEMTKFDKLVGANLRMQAREARKAAEKAAEEEKKAKLAAREAKREQKRIKSSGCVCGTDGEQCGNSGEVPGVHTGEAESNAVVGQTGTSSGPGQPS